MKQSKLAIQFLALVLIISLVTGCGKGNSPAAASQTATPDPDLDSINTVIQDAQSVTAEQANQAELDMLNLQRDKSGARAAFGDQADVIFLQIDQNRAAVLEEMVNRATGAVNTPLKVSVQLVKPETSGTTRASPLDKPSYMTNTMVQAFISLLMATEIAGIPRDNNGNGAGPLTEGGDPVGAAGTHYTFQPMLFGSRMEVKGTLTTTQLQPFPYQETIEYDLLMDVCPDAEGLVPISLSLHSAASLLGGGVQLGVESLVTGHVNDEGKLDSTDYNLTYQGARQPIQQGVGENLGTVNTFFEYQENFTSYQDPGIRGTTGSIGYTRQSSETDARFNHDAVQEMRFMGFFVTIQALSVAEKKWTTGFCLELNVPELGADTKTVEPGSSTPFTAHVRHKFEGAELPLPVVATLSAGQVSVTPSGSKVPAPAAFTYKAADQDGQSATVSLETRSKRGIAKLDVKFITGVATWTGEGNYRKSVNSSGIVVSMAYTFTITFHTLPDGTIAGEGVLKKTESSNSGPDRVCKDLGTTAALVFPPLNVSGTVKPDGTFQLTILSQPSTNTWKWECSFSHAGINIGTLTTDEGADLGPPTLVFEIAATDGAQAQGSQDLGGYGGTTGSATWTLQIHKQAAP
jgi:hypothetical protein